MERVPTDDKDRPTVPIKILETKVFVDPFADAEAAKLAEQDKAKSEQEKARVNEAAAEQVSSKPVTGAVGMYLKPVDTKRKSSAETEVKFAAPVKQKKKARSGTGGFGDFSAW